MPGIRALAEQDLGKILEDKVTGFGWDIKLTTPDGTVANLIGFSNDISQVVDPDTGLLVSARQASIAIRTALILAALPCDGLPVGISDGAAKPWLVSFADINGYPHTFKVVKSNPDRAIGLVTCILEAYNND
jgi:hypothetical protein